jgi:hypothetical protein
VVRVDQKQDCAIEGKRKSEPHRPTLYQQSILSKHPGPQADLTDTDAGKKISGIEQDTAGLNRKRIVARLQP